MKNLLVILVCIFFAFCNNLFAIEWKPFGNLNKPRLSFQTQVISDSLILVMGGFPDSYYINPAESSCEIINIKSRIISYTNPMNSPHAYFASVLTPDSNVIAMGGFGGFDIVELFDRKTFKWKVLGNLMLGRAMHTATMINDSEIVVIGGYTYSNPGISNCELFNIKTGISKNIASVPLGGNGPLSFKSSNNTVFSFGGRAGGPNSNRLSGIFGYNQQKNSWENHFNLNMPTYMLSNLKLTDNSNLFGGGSDSESPFIFQRSFYFEKNGNFTIGGNLLSERVWFKMAQWNERKVLVIGGFNNYNQNIKSCEWIDLQNMGVSAGPSLITGRRYLHAVSCQNPKNPSTNIILAIAGSNENEYALSSIEILEDISRPPQITNISKSCNEYTITFSDDDGFDAIDIVNSESNNIKIGSIKSTPPNITKVKLSLVDQTKIGYFVIKYKSNNGLEISLKDTIFSKGYSLSASKNLIYNINAHDLNDTIRLTDNNYNYRGSVWMNKKINVADGFSTSFGFKYSDGKNRDCDDKSEQGADGFAFVIQNSSLKECGFYGGGIGYDGIKNAIAFEFDTYSNDSTEIDDFKDPNGNHFAINYSKNSISAIHNSQNTLFVNSKIPILKNNVIYNISIDYNIEPKTLRVYLDSAGKNNQLIARITDFDFNKYMTLENNKFSYIGFTSGTGCAVANHDILNWELCSEMQVLDISEKANYLPLISPNPATDFIILYLGQWDDRSNLNQIEIFNALGEALNINKSGLIQFEGNETIKIDISNFPVGIYFIKIGDKIEKFIKT